MTTSRACAKSLCFCTTCEGVGRSAWTELEVQHVQGGQTCMSGRGSSQDMVYRKVAGNPEGASVLGSAKMVDSWGTRPIQM